MYKVERSPPAVVFVSTDDTAHASTMPIEIWCAEFYKRKKEAGIPQDTLISGERHLAFLPSVDDFRLYWQYCRENESRAAEERDGCEVETKETIYDHEEEHKKAMNDIAFLEAIAEYAERKKLQTLEKVEKAISDFVTEYCSANSLTNSK